MNRAYSNAGLRFDEDGFLVNTQAWNDEAAEGLAREDGIGELTDGHWRVIHYLRKHYLEEGSLPHQALVCREGGMEGHCVERLFCGMREAWRVAGLPNPGEEIKTYL